MEERETLCANPRCYIYTTKSRGFVWHKALFHSKECAEAFMNAVRIIWCEKCLRSIGENDKKYEYWDGDTLRVRKLFFCSDVCRADWIREKNQNGRE